MEGVTLTKMYCKHFCKCQNVPIVQQAYENKDFKRYKIKDVIK
jgi:hypothetical protein